MISMNFYTLSTHRLLTKFLFASSFTMLIFISFKQIDCLSKNIKIGGIFSKQEIEQHEIFRYAIDRLNADQSMLARSRLQPHIALIDPDDSFHGEKKVCALLQNDSIALFGPLRGHRVYFHVQSISDSLEIPHVQFDWLNSWIRSSSNVRNALSINLYPNAKKLSQAYIDCVKAWSWKTFVILYEANEGLIRVQDFLKEAERHEWTIRLYQFSPERLYRDVFWEIKQAKIDNVLLDVKRENIFLALKHAQQVGMMTQNQNYLITSLDLHTVRLENFQYSKTKITALRLIDMSSHELADILRYYKGHSYFGNKEKLEDSTVVKNSILTETALLYDSVKLFANALIDLDQSQSVTMPSKTTSCIDMNPWLYGTSLMNYMRQITFQGVTGIVGFDQQGKRNNFILDVVSITSKGLQKIGYWNANGANMEERLNISEEWSSIFSTATLQNKTLIVTTYLNDPYCMLRDTSETKYGNDRFEGFVIDLIGELSELLGFKYVFKLVDDGKYGSVNENGTWNGLIGEVINKVADIAVVDLTITLKRAEAVDFTLPFMNTGISILFKKPTTKVTTLFSFLSPFTGLVWISLLSAYIVVSTILFIVGRMSPYEWENPNPCQQDDDVLENNFSLTNSFFFTIGSMMQQGSELTPKAMSTRAVAAIWYFFTLIMISSYTANLAAFLTVEKVIYPINSAEELSRQTNIEYGCLKSGSTENFFKETKIKVFAEMWKFMQSRPHVFMSKNDQGKKRVEQGGYAYLMEGASIEYIVERNCNLTQIGGLLDTKGYGIALRKSPIDSKYRHLLSQAILSLQESGRLHLLKDKWWKQKKGGGQCLEDSKKTSSTVTALKIDNVGGVFVVLIGGLSLAFLVAICEFLCDSRKMMQTCDSICEEMVNDLKFSLKCYSKTKPNREKSSSLQMSMPIALQGPSGQAMSHHSSNDSSMYLQPIHQIQPQSLNNSTYLASYLGLPRHQQVVPRPTTLQPVQLQAMHPGQAVSSTTNIDGFNVS